MYGTGAITYNFQALYFEPPVILEDILACRPTSNKRSMHNVIV